MTEAELIKFITEVANQVRDAKGHVEHVSESDTESIVQAIRFINKVKVLKEKRGK